MLKDMLSISLGLVLAPLAAIGQQPELKATNDHPEPGQVVVIEVNVHADQNTKIVWLKDSGEGDFETATTDQSRVSFRPSKPGDVVIIVCEVSTPKGQNSAKKELYVSAQAPTTAAGPPRVQHVPTLPVVTQHAGGTLKIDSIENMVPSGYMGDAMSENGGTVNLDPGYNRNCHSEPSCYRMEYSPGRAGWAAIGWQHVIEGSMNWGESPGVDLQDRGFRSLRIWACGERSASGMYPRAQFKSGGNTAPKYKPGASYAVAGPTVQLGAQLSEYCLDLADRNLSNVVSPFTVVVTRGANPAGAVVILSDIHFSTQPCPPQ